MQTSDYSLLQNTPKSSKRKTATSRYLQKVGTDDIKLKDHSSIFLIPTLVINVDRSTTAI